MEKFDYDDIVRVVDENITKDPRTRTRAWVVGIQLEETRKRDFLERFPIGTTYTIEFEDGSSMVVAESSIELIERPRES